MLKATKNIYMPFFFFKICVLSRIQLFATPWTVVHQAPLSMGDSLGTKPWEGIFPTQESNLGLPHCKQTLQADSLLSEQPGKPKNTGVVTYPFSPAELPNPGLKPGSPALQVDSLPAELPQDKLLV